MARYPTGVHGTERIFQDLIDAAPPQVAEYLKKALRQFTEAGRRGEQPLDPHIIQPPTAARTVDISKQPPPPVPGLIPEQQTGMESILGNISLGRAEAAPVSRQRRTGAELPEGTVSTPDDTGAGALRGRPGEPPWQPMSAMQDPETGFPDLGGMQARSEIERGRPMGGPGLPPITMGGTMEAPPVLPPIQMEGTMQAGPQPGLPPMDIQATQQPGGIDIQAIAQALGARTPEEVMQILRLLSQMQPPAQGAMGSPLPAPSPQPHGRASGGY